MEATSPAGVAESFDNRPVVLCGLGRVGQEILRLLRRLGQPVRIITQQSTHVDVGEDVEAFMGDARDEKLLDRAGIHDAKALIAATDDDLVNVTIAMHARHVAPSLPVVVRLFDQELATHLQRALGIRQGYSASALAAPAFVAAAQGSSVATAFELGDEHWFLEERALTSDAKACGKTVAEIAADMGVVLCLKRDDKSAILPEPERILQAGDRLYLLVRHDEGGTQRRRLRHRLTSTARGLHGFWKSTPRGLRLALYGLLAIVAISVGVFHSVLKLSFVDAYYFVVTTLTTTGYGDVNLQNASPAAKIYGTMVMVSGGALFAVIFSMMTDLLLRTRFADVLAQGTRHRRGHIIVAGLGNTGFRVARHLVALGEDVVAIENGNEGKFLATARTLAPVVHGDASAAETLDRAGLAGAKAVIAATNDDLTNVSVALAAKQARPSCHVASRVLDRALATKIQQTMAIDAVISVTCAAAPTFVGAALTADLVRGVVIGDHLVLFTLRTEEAMAHDERALLAAGSDGTFHPIIEAATPGPRLCARWIPLQR